MGTFVCSDLGLLGGALFGVMYSEWYGVCYFVVLSVIELCVDYGGVNVFHVCLNFGVIYGVGVCVNICVVVCVCCPCMLFFITSECCVVMQCGGCCDFCLICDECN